MEIFDLVHILDGDEIPLTTWVNGHVPSALSLVYMRVVAAHATFHGQSFRRGTPTGVSDKILPLYEEDMRRSKEK